MRFELMIRLSFAARTYVVLSALALSLMTAATSFGAVPAKPGYAASARLMQGYGKLPLRFEANQGQSDARVHYLSRGNGYGLYLTANDAVLALHKSLAGAPATDSADVIRMQLQGADPGTQPQGLDRLPGTSNYLIGDDPLAWHTSVPNFARVRYAAVYPGIDLVYYGNQQQLEYDFIVAAGADPKQIQLHFAGADALALDSAGNLVIRAREGSIAFHRPVLYQVRNGRRNPVEGRFAMLANHSVGFVIGRYDHASPLVIDPTLVYSTYLGGSSSDSISGIAVDSTGAAYITGNTSSTDYPTTPGAFQTTSSTAFVSKLNASGTALLYSTFLGGPASSQPANQSNGIAVDASGNAYVTGTTNSTSFPVTSSALQKTNPAAANHGAAGFVTKINPNGTGLVYSTYLGGTYTNGANALVLDSSGDVYIAGYTYSKDFPTTAGVVQPANNSFNDSGWNEYVAKLNPAGTALLYATCIGGSGDYGSPEGIALAVDSSGDAYVTSTVLSHDFPVTTGAYQTTNKATGRGNVTIAKLNPTATKLLYATYLGTTSSNYGDDLANGIAVDSAGNAYVAGVTRETDFPVTSGAFLKTNPTGGTVASTGFVTKLNATGSALVYSTFLGGSGQNVGDAVNALAVDSAGDVYVTGTTGSANFPVTSNAYQKTNVAQNYGAVSFVTELNPAGGALVYSTYFGGTTSFGDAGTAVYVDANSNVYFAGLTTANNLPTTSGAYQTANHATQGGTGYVAKLSLGAAPTTLATATTLASSANPAVNGSNITFSAYVAPATGTAIPAGNVIFSIDQKTVATVALSSKGFANYTTMTPLSLGQHAILASYAGNATYSASASNITQSIIPATPTFSPAGGIYPSAVLVTLADATAGTTLYYTTDGSVPSASSTKYTTPILVSTSESIRVIGIAANAPNSTVTTASYQLITAPYALAVPASAIATPKATLNGLANTYGLAGTYYFQYGTSSTALTNSTAKTAIGSSGLASRISFAPVLVSAPLTSLAAKTTYYYQVVITTTGGSSSGAVLSFTTN